MSIDGWLQVSLEEVCSLITDGTHHSPPNGSAGVYRYVTAKNIRPWGLDLDDVTWVTPEVHREIYTRCPVEYEDVLYIKDGVTTGLAALNHLREPFSMLSSVALLKPRREIIQPSYLKHWLNNPETFARMTANMTGSAIRRLVLRQIREATIHVPPFNEQKRITDKLDTLLARVDACRERLDCVPAILKRFRQSVLAAATSGQLTEEWRTARRDVYTATEILRQIATERSRRGLPSALREIKAEGIDIPETELSATWAWCRVGQIADVRLGGTPSRKESTYWNGDIPWVSSGEVSNCRINDTTEKISRSGMEHSNAKLYPKGSVLIAMIGEGKTRGQSAILDIEATTNQNVYFKRP